MNKKKCIIVDLEGTLSDHSHRLHHIPGDYDAYNKAFKDDPVNKGFIEELKAAVERTDAEVVLCTAKSITYKNNVTDWIEQNGMSEYICVFYFRGKLDSRSSVLVKRDMLKDIKLKYDVILAYDDRQDICDMFRENGVPAYLVETEYQNHTHSNMTGAGKILINAANLHMEKNKEYGDGYKEFGKIIMSFFPDGLKIETPKDASRFAILNIIIAKLDRYCKNFNNGGHSDSLKDISVYAAMLQEVDES